jgi:hypothetical protein
MADARKVVGTLALVGIGGVVAYFLYNRFLGDGVIKFTDWPGAPNDLVLRVAQAIAIAEGSPASWNNPGDVTAGDAGGFPLQRDSNGALIVNSAGVVRFVNKSDGVQALYRKLLHIQNGVSHVYSASMSILEFAQAYTGGDAPENWANNVAKSLGLDPNGSTIGDALGVA